MNDTTRAGEEPRRRRRLHHVPLWVHSRIHPARRVALVAVAAFELSEAALLWRRGLETQNLAPLILGFLVLLLLLAFEIDESAATRRERELAQEIVEWMSLRVPPSIPHLEIAFHTRRVERIAGDYVTVFPRWPHAPDAESRRAFVAMVDVAGLGLQGALLMATFQAGLRTLADARLPLSDLATLLNRWTWDRSQGGRHFVMGFFADLHPATGDLRYLNAGHQPPLLLRATGRPESLELRGFPLGVQREARYEFGSSIMEVGDSLVVFTDGAAGARDHRGEPFGAERIRQSLEHARDFSAGEVLDQILTSVLSFAGSTRQQDDISVLVVKRVG